MSLAAVRRENTSASNVFVFVCVFSSLPPAPCTAAAFLLSGQHSYVVGLRRACMHVAPIAKGNVTPLLRLTVILQEFDAPNPRF